MTSGLHISCCVNLNVFSYKKRCKNVNVDAGGIVRVKIIFPAWDGGAHHH